LLAGEDSAPALATANGVFLCLLGCSIMLRQVMGQARVSPWFALLAVALNALAAGVAHLTHAPQNFLLLSTLAAVASMVIAAALTLLASGVRLSARSLLLSAAATLVACPAGVVSLRLLQWLEGLFS
jgi:hypothetical protein